LETIGTILVSALFKQFVNINGTETTDKDKTVRKICVNDASYKTSNTSNMATHLQHNLAVVF
jgi:hypothetical protein